IEVAISFRTYSEVACGMDSSGLVARKTEWKRQQRTHKHSIPIPNEKGASRDSQVLVGSRPEDPVATVEWIVQRRASSGGGASVTLSVFLLNTTPWLPEARDDGNVRNPDDQFCLFQPALSLTGHDGTFPFVARNPEGTWASS